MVNEPTQEFISVEVFAELLQPLCEEAHSENPHISAPALEKLGRITSILEEAKAERDDD